METARLTKVVKTQTAVDALKGASPSMVHISWVYFELLEDPEEDAVHMEVWPEAA